MENKMKRTRLDQSFTIPKESEIDVTKIMVDSDGLIKLKSKKNRKKEKEFSESIVSFAWCSNYIINSFEKNNQYSKLYCLIMNIIDFRFWFCDCNYTSPYGLVVAAECKKHNGKVNEKWKRTKIC